MFIAELKFKKTVLCPSIVVIFVLNVSPLPQVDPQ
jgi:hypothetical protein